MWLRDQGLFAEILKLAEVAMRPQNTTTKYSGHIFLDIYI